MKYYQDITLLPDQDVDLYFLWGKVYQQVHLALVEQKCEANKVDIGVSFPNYIYDKSRAYLGNKLRLCASTESGLNRLDAGRWLNRLRDYVHLTQVRLVPDKVEYVHFYRKQIKSLEKVAKRRATHLNISVDEAMSFLEKEGRGDRTDLPFIQMESLSSQHSGGRVARRFPLFIQKCMSKGERNGGRFDCYGLSKTATVPWF